MRKIKSLIVLIMAISIFASCNAKNPIINLQGIFAQATTQTSDAKEIGKLKISIADVGQADSILVQFGEKNLLVDAGNNADSDTILSYLKSRNVKSLDAFILTHPHEDHIGAADDVIINVPVKSIYMPKAKANTRTFEDVLAAIKDKGLKVNTAKAGVNINLDPELKIQMLAPNSSTYDDTNQYSAVLKITYKNISALLCGDAGDVSEKEMLAKGYNLKSQILKVGHHGSKYASSTKFLKAVMPSYCAISVGANNDYNHPHKQALDRLNATGAKIYRTDLDGTIIFSTDGKTVAVRTIS